MLPWGFQMRRAPGHWCRNRGRPGVHPAPVAGDFLKKSTIRLAIPRRGIILCPAPPTRRVIRPRFRRGRALWKRNSAMRCAGRAIRRARLRGARHSAARPDPRVRQNLNRRSIFSAMESLILAQNERWRHGLGMQVERGAAMRPVAKGCATREEPAPGSGTSAGNGV